MRGRRSGHGPTGTLRGLTGRRAQRRRCVASRKETLCAEPYPSLSTRSSSFSTDDQPLKSPHCAQYRMDKQDSCSFDRQVKRHEIACASAARFPRAISCPRSPDPPRCRRGRRRSIRQSPRPCRLPAAGSPTFDRPWRDGQGHPQSREQLNFAGCRAGTRRSMRSLSCIDQTSTTRTNSKSF